MDFLRNALNTRLSRRRRRQHPSSPSPPSSPPPPTHALDTLPTLPHPRRPLTPTPPHPQSQSPFFTLPAELRLKIYHHLLTSPTPLHLDLRYTAAHTPSPHSTSAASLLPGRAWRWSASHCHRHPLSASPLADCCATGGAPPTACALHSTTTSCGIGREVLGLLRSCRAVYRESAAVLYATNVFHVSSGALLLYTPRLLPAERAGMVRRAVVSVTEANVWDYAGEHLGIEGGLAAYRMLIGRVREAFPGLVALEVVVKGALARGRVGGERGELGVLDGGEVRGCLLGAMDGVVAGYGGQLGEDCVLAMGVEAFDRVMEGELAGAERVELREGVWLQFWRPVRVAARGEGTVVETGYWVRRVFPDERAGPLDSIEAALSEYLSGLTLTYAGDGSTVLVGVSTAEPSADPPQA